MKFGSHGETRRETRARESPRYDNGADSSTLPAANPIAGPTGRGGQFCQHRSSYVPLHMTTGTQSRSAPTPEGTMDVTGRGPAEYLRRFFSELERLKCRLICDVSHAIGFRDGKLYVLMSIGDFRERVYVEELDEDPASAAQDVFLLWRTTPRVDEEIE